MTERERSTSGAAMGTFAGVFTPSLLTILGVILFLRLGFVVGDQGLARALSIICLAQLIAVLTSCSLAAIATNLQIRGGGDYYIISRTLGLGFGGPIGILLFLAQSVSVGFYCLGFAEALAGSFGLQAPQAVPLIALAGVAVLFVLVWQGVSWATRFQYLVMALLGLALLVFVLGSLRYWQPANLLAAWHAPASHLNYWTAFAIFFPAVTGFTQGVSMSGDLADPGRSIPRGTFASVAVSMGVYLLVALLFAGALSLTALRQDYRAMWQLAAWRPAIDAGLFAAALSSALASFLGAPRILQQLARDRLLGWLRPFAKGHGHQNNPRRGVLLSAAIAVLVVLVGDLNHIAALVTMFFLVSYGLVNYATFFEARAASPSFRPGVSWFDPRLSLLGAIGCLLVIMATGVIPAILAVLVLVLLRWVVLRQNPVERWADSRRSYHLQRTRIHLLAAHREPAHPRDWRPYILAFSDDALHRERLAQMAEWLTGGSGLTTIVHIMTGQARDQPARRREAQDALEHELAAGGFSALPLVVSAESFEASMPIVIQAAGYGPTRINTVLVNWIEPPARPLDGRDDIAYGQNLRSAFRLGCNLLLLSTSAAAWDKTRAQPGADQRIDVWWQDTASGELMLMLAYLLKRNREWRDATLRVLVEAGPKQLDEAENRLLHLLGAARIRATVERVQGSDSAALIRHSQDASLVFAGFSICKGHICDQYGKPVAGSLKQLPTVVLTMAAEDVDLTPDPDTGLPHRQAQAADRLLAARDELEHARRQLEIAEQAVHQAAHAMAQAAHHDGTDAVSDDLQRRLREAQARQTRMARQVERAELVLDAASERARALGVPSLKGVHEVDGADR